MALLASGRRRRSILLLVLAIAVAAALGVGIYVRWHRPTPPDPPAVDLTDADPVVVRTLESAAADVRQSPRCADAWGNLGLLLLAHDYRGESLPCFAEAEQLDPAEPRWPYFQGVVLAVRGEPDAALPKLRRAVDHWPGEPAPRLRLAEALLALGRLDEAEPLLDSVVQGAPGPLVARARLGLAQVAFERGDLPKSLDLLGPCAASPFTRKAAHARMAEICEAQGNKTGADRQAAEAANWPDDLPWPDPFVEECKRLQTGLTGLLSRAAKLVEQDRAAEAIPLMQDAVHDYPDSCLAWLTLGRARLRLRDFAGAERAFRNAVRLGPQVVEAHFYLGAALFEQGDHRAALESFRRATELKPDYALAQFNLGQCLAPEGDRKGAVEAFRVAVRCKPHFAAAHRKLGELLLALGERDEAREQLRLAVELDPADADARSLLERIPTTPPAEPRRVERPCQWEGSALSARDCGHLPDAGAHRAK
jgi:tetratricopeptide (TPR) repeat protein